MILNEFRSMVDYTKYDIEKARFLAKKYGKNIAESMHENLRNANLINKKELYDSIRFSVSTKHDEVDKISFSYAYYGIFLEHGITFQKKNPSKKMLQKIMDNYQVDKQEAFVIARSILRNGIKASKWRSKAIQDNQEDLDREFSEFYAEIILKEIEIEDVKLKH